MTRVDADRLDAVASAAARNPRRRMNDNLHAMDDAVHRLLNAFEPDSYVRPHRHAAPRKVETVAVLRGRGAVVQFDDAGRVADVAVLSPAGPVHVAEVAAGVWHTLIALEHATVWFEVKEGPYAAPPPGDFAPWAPEPGAPGAAAYLESVRAAVSAWVAATPGR